MKAVLEKIYRSTDYVIGSEDRSYYTAGDNGETVTLGKKATASTIAHELFHKLDKGEKISRELFDGLIQDYVALNVLSEGDIKGYLIAQYPEAFAKNLFSGKILMKSEYRGIADILNGLSDGTVWYGYGHGKNYWADIRALESEAWAQFGRVYYTNDAEVVIMFEELFPNLVREAKRKLKGLM